MPYFNDSISFGELGNPRSSYFEYILRETIFISSCHLSLTPIAILK